MQRRTKKKKAGFGTGLLIYVIVMLILSVTALLLFYDWLGAYENSRPAVAVEHFRQQLDENGLTDACHSALAEVDRALQSETEITAFAENVLDSAVYARSLSGEETGQIVYMMRVDGNNIGKLTLKQTGDKKFGFQSWEVAKEEYDFSSFYSSFSVTVPEDYQVLCSGTVLDRSYITESGIEYATLASYYADYPSLPHLVRYTSGIRLGFSEMEVLDRSGKPVSEKEMTDQHFLDVCNATDKARLSEFTREFMSNYIQFTANVGGGFYYYYSLCRQMVAPDSPLLDRMGQAVQSFGFTTTKSCDVIRDSVNLCTRIDANHYLTDYTYTTEIVSPDGRAQDTRNVRLLIEVSPKDQLLVSLMNNY